MGCYSDWKPITGFSAVLNLCFQYLKDTRAVPHSWRCQPSKRCFHRAEVLLPVKGRWNILPCSFFVEGGWDTIAPALPVCGTRRPLLLLGILRWAVKVWIIVGSRWRSVPKAFVSQVLALTIRAQIYANAGNSKRKEVFIFLCVKWGKWKREVIFSPLIVWSCSIELNGYSYIPLKRSRIGNDCLLLK